MRGWWINTSLSQPSPPQGGKGFTKSRHCERSEATQGPDADLK